MAVSGVYVTDSSHTIPIGKFYPPKGLVGPNFIPFWLDTPSVKKFDKEFYEFTKGLHPSMLSLGAWELVRFAADAIQKAGTTDIEKVIDALEGLTVETPIGPVKMRALDHQGIHPIWFGEGTLSPNYKIAIGVNDVKYGEELYLTEEQTKPLLHKE